MFRATVCPSSGGTTVFTRHLVLVILYGWLSGKQGGMKHEEKRNKHTKKKCASSWLYLQHYTGMYGQQNVTLTSQTSTNSGSNTENPLRVFVCQSWKWLNFSKSKHVCIRMWYKNRRLNWSEICLRTSLSLDMRPRPWESLSRRPEGPRSSSPGKKLFEKLKALRPFRNVGNRLFNDVASYPRRMEASQHFTRLFLFTSRNSFGASGNTAILSPVKPLTKHADSS
jgi:hypothetical protein